MKRILEIGGGMTPYFIRYDIPWNEDDEYICLDVTEQNVDVAERTFAKYAKAGKTVPKNFNFVTHDATSLPFQDELFDEIIISNTLSAPIHHNFNEQGTHVHIANEHFPIERAIPILAPDYEKEFYAEKDLSSDLFYRERKPLVDEAFRTLAKGGILSVYTDLIIYGIHAYEKVLEELKNNSETIYFADELEQNRINALNDIKRFSGEYCFCFNAEVLPRSEVHRFLRK